MKPFRTGNLAVTLASFILFALLCATIAYWVMQLTARRSPLAPAEIIADPRANLDLASAGQLFGAAPGAAAAVAQVSNIQVIGLVASDVRGSAVLIVDGKPARPVMVGEDIVDGTRLIAVKADAAVIERGGQRIDLPAPTRPSVSLLTSGQAAGSGNGGSSSGGAPAVFAPRPIPGSGTRASPSMGAPAMSPPAMTTPPMISPAPPSVTASGMPDPRLLPPGGVVPAPNSAPMTNPSTPAPNLVQPANAGGPPGMPAGQPPASQ